MGPRKPKTRTCVITGQEFPATDTHLFEPLEFFEDLCFSNEILTLEREGEPPPKEQQEGTAN
jgi:hypothetical protein